MRIDARLTLIAGVCIGLSMASVLCIGSLYLHRQGQAGDAFAIRLLERHWAFADADARAALLEWRSDGLSTAAKRFSCEVAADPGALDEWVRRYPTQHVEVVDRRASIRYTNSPEIEVEPLAAMSIIEQAQRSDVPMVFFGALGRRHYGWIVASRIDCGTLAETDTEVDVSSASEPMVLLVGRDVEPVLTEMGARLGGVVRLIGAQGIIEPHAARIGVNDGGASGRGGDIDTDAIGDLPIDRGTPQHHAEVVLTRIDGHRYRRVVLPLPGLAERPSTILEWREVSVLYPDELLIERSLIACIVGVPILAVMVFQLVTRVLLLPMERAIAGLRDLANRRYDAMLDDEDGERQDEAGQVVRDVVLLRGEMLNLQMLRAERIRGMQQQGRLIRTQLHRLAAGLDDTERQDITRWLDALDWHESGESNPLVDLSMVLARLSDMIDLQHRKLLGLLRELSKALENEAHFAMLRQELEIARQIQLSILPKAPPHCRNIDLNAVILPAREVGGDFYDYFMLDERHLAMVVADVSGKGVPAAFFMAIARSLLKNTAAIVVDPAATISRLNDLLCDDNPQLMFVTLFYGVLDVVTGDFRYVNAGHNPPLLARGGHAEFLPANRNMALGVLAQQTFTSARMHLLVGDVILLYTDGLTEAHDVDDVLFGASALQTVFASVSRDAATAESINAGLIAAIRHFENGDAQADDITCLTCRLQADERLSGTDMASFDG